MAQTFDQRGGYSGEAYARGTQALLMKRQLDKDVAQLVIENNPSTEICVADFGAGVGILATVLEKEALQNGKRVKYVAVEPSRPQLEELSRINNGVELERTAVRRMPMNAPMEQVKVALPCATLDAVTMENSLYALTENLTIQSANEQREIAVRNAAYTLKPDGVFVITDPLNAGPGMPIRREFELAKRQGMTTFQAIKHLAGLLVNKDVAQASSKTRKNLVESTQRFENVDELIAFVTRTGLFEVVEGTQRNDAYLGNSAIVAFRRTNKQVSLAEIPDITPVVDPLKQIDSGDLPTQSQTEGDGTEENPMRFVLRGEPKNWPESFKKKFMDFEFECFKQYPDVDKRIEGDAYFEDFLLEKREADLLADENVEILGIQHRFYAYGEKVKAYLCLVDFELKKEIEWHGIILRPGRYVIPRKIMQDGTVKATQLPYWDDLYAHVAKLFTEDRTHVACAMHMQPMSLAAISRAKIIDRDFHAQPENWWLQTPEQQKTFAQMNAYLNNPILRYILERMKPIIYKRLVKNRIVIPLLPYSAVAFNPDDDTNKSGYVVVRFNK